MSPAKKQQNPARISFSTTLGTIGDWTVLRLPLAASKQLPSRGQSMVEGIINGHHFITSLEPDGKGSHWFRVDAEMRSSIKAEAGDKVTLDIAPVDEWPEPEVPSDLKKAIESTPATHSLWNEITPMARWDWIRWVRATKNAQTRAKRIAVALDKLKKGTRRPCCFNRTECTIQEVSNRGVLIDPV